MFEVNIMVMSFFKTLIRVWSTHSGDMTVSKYWCLKEIIILESTIIKLQIQDHGNIFAFHYFFLGILKKRTSKCRLSFSEK